MNSFNCYTGFPRSAHAVDELYRPAHCSVSCVIHQLPLGKVRQSSNRILGIARIF